MKIMIQTILKGCSAELIAVGQGTDPYYYWTPGTGLDYPTKDTVTAKPETTTKYYVFTSDADTNVYSCCSEPASVVVKVVDAKCTNCGSDIVECPLLFSSKTLNATILSGYTYQWQRRLPCDTFKNITGATGTSYTVSSWSYGYGNLCGSGGSGLDWREIEIPGNYYRVKVTSPSGCSQYSNIQSFHSYSFSPCRMEELEETPEPESKDELLVYPNPTQGTFTLELNNKGVTDHAQVRVYNLIGRLVFDRQVPVHEGVNDLNFTFNDNLSDGIYLIEVRNGTQVLHGRVSKNKY